MEFFDTIDNRHSSRAFSDRDVADEDLAKILHAINRCPTAGNLQAYQVYVVKNKDVRNELVPTCFNQAFIAQAPVSLIFMTNPDRNRETYGEMADKLYAFQDATIACAYAELAVTALGMSACWIGGGIESEIHRLTGAPEQWKTNSILCFGYPTDNPDKTTRRDLSAIYTEI